MAGYLGLRRIYRLFEMVVFLVVIYIAFAVPFEMTFREYSSTKFSTVNSILPVLIVFDTVGAGTLAVIDHTALWPYVIRFMFDIASLPSVVAAIFHKNIGLFGFCRMLPIWRIVKIFSELSRFEDFYIVRLAKVICVVLLDIHYGCCVLYALAVRKKGNDGKWTDQIKEFSDLNFWNKYVNSSYLAMMSLSTIGYGDLHAVNMAEKLFTMLYAFVQLGIIPYISEGLSFWTYKPKSSRTSTAAPVRNPRFDEIVMAPPDHALGSYAAYISDTSARKLNLSVGALCDEHLRPYPFTIVDVVKARLRQQHQNTSNYFQTEDFAAFCNTTTGLLFGADHFLVQEQRVATAQCLSGTGSLRLAAEFIHHFFPGSQVLISAPTWGMHKNILNATQVPWLEYRYFNSTTIGLDLDGMAADLRAAPRASFVLLQGCGHNSTGIDPSPDEWENLANVIIEKSHIPLFDFAYQGFARGTLYGDAFSLRIFADLGMDLLVAQSFSKNLGLCDERVGALNVVCVSAAAATRVKSQMKKIARTMYSNLPTEGANIVAAIVGNPQDFNGWNQEMREVRNAIYRIRQQLYNDLISMDPVRNWSFVVHQKGLFVFIGAGIVQRNYLTNNQHIYMTDDGGMSLGPILVLAEHTDRLIMSHFIAHAIVESYSHTR